MANLDQIANFFVKTISVSPLFNSPNPVSDQSLLFPDFVILWKKCITEYQKKYPAHRITFSETYRSNVLQEKYFNSGASKIKKNGMHHYGIAGDTIFIIDGKESYKGDIELIRQIYTDNKLTVLGMWDPLHVQFIVVGDQQKLRDMINNLSTT